MRHEPQLIQVLTDDTKLRMSLIETRLDAVQHDQEKKASQSKKPETIWSLGWLLIKLYVGFHVILFVLAVLLGAY